MRFSTRLARLGGVAAVVGGALWSAKAFYDRNDAPPWPTDVTDDLMFVVFLLFLAGFTGLYARCRGRLGQDWGSVAFASYLGGLVGLVPSLIGSLTMTSEVGPAWWLGISWWMFVFGFFATNLSLVFFGSAVLQGDTLARWKFLPLATGALGTLLIAVGDPPNSDLGVYPTLALWMLYGFGWALLGLVLLAGERSALGSPASGRPETNV